jgi:hypothetical protein
MFLAIFSWCHRCWLSRAAPCFFITERRRVSSEDQHRYISKVSRPSLLSFGASLIFPASSDAGIADAPDAVVPHITETANLWRHSRETSSRVAAYRGLGRRRNFTRVYRLALASALEPPNELGVEMWHSRADASASVAANRARVRTAAETCRRVRDVVSPVQATRGERPARACRSGAHPDLHAGRRGARNASGRWAPHSPSRLSSLSKESSSSAMSTTRSAARS